MKYQFRVINRTTREEQIFNSKELKRFFYCEFDHQTGELKYNVNEMSDYAISPVKSITETWAETIGFSCLGLAIVILTTKIIMSWI